MYDYPGTQAVDKNITVTCPDCGTECEVDAIIDGGYAYWPCPSTQCERNYIDPQKSTEWYGDE